MLCACQAQTSETTLEGNIECRLNSDCSQGESCIDGNCTPRLPEDSSCIDGCACSTDRDCDSGYICDALTRTCTQFECENDSDCSFGDTCINYLCVTDLNLDTDRDGVPDGTAGEPLDNCVNQPNPDQLNSDGDQLGNACDDDDDNDFIPDSEDNCPLVANRDQSDFDEDGQGDRCEDEFITLCGDCPVDRIVGDTVYCSETCSTEPLCLPDSQRCFANQRQICQQSGIYEDVPCPENYNCVENTEAELVECIVQLCSPSSFRCNGSAREVCSNDGYEWLEAPCPDLLVCDEINGLASCVTPCGNGRIDHGEECDDGDQDNTNSCTNECLRARCGDSFVSVDEQCDRGEDNSDSIPNRCRTTCLLPTCGDTVIDDGEECDDGNRVDNDGCSNACLEGRCGDGIVSTNLTLEDCRNDILSCVSDGLELCDGSNYCDDDYCLPGEQGFCSTYWHQECEHTIIETPELSIITGTISVEDDFDVFTYDIDNCDGATINTWGDLTCPRRTLIYEMGFLDNTGITYDHLRALQMTFVPTADHNNNFSNEPACDHICNSFPSASTSDLWDKNYYSTEYYEQQNVSDWSNILGRSIFFDDQKIYGVLFHEKLGNYALTMSIKLPYREYRYPDSPINGRLVSGGTYPQSYINTILGRSYYLIIKEGDCGFEEIVLNEYDQQRGNTYRCFPQATEIGDPCLLHENFTNMEAVAQCPAGSFCYVDPGNLPLNSPNDYYLSDALNLIGECMPSPQEAGDQCFNRNDITNSTVRQSSRCPAGDCREILGEYVCTLCGNGLVDPGEQCDSGNQRDRDCSYGEQCMVCTQSCTFEAGITHLCGDDQLDESEQCDDGNTINGDGCDANCNIELDINRPLGNSQILTASQVTSVMNWLDIGDNVEWNRCYQGTRNNLNETDFISSCSQLGTTLTIVRLNSGNILGGYSTVSWHQDPFEEVYDEAALDFTFHTGPLTTKSVGQSCGEFCTIDENTFRGVNSNGNLMSPRWLNFALNNNLQDVDCGLAGMFSECSQGFPRSIECEEYFCGSRDDSSSLNDPSYRSVHSIEVWRANVSNCGNQRIDPDEICDDGDLDSSNGCTSECTLGLNPSEVSLDDFSNSQYLAFEASSQSVNFNFSINEPSHVEILLGNGIGPIGENCSEFDGISYQVINSSLEVIETGTISDSDYSDSCKVPNLYLMADSYQVLFSYQSIVDRPLLIQITRLETPTPVCANGQCECQDDGWVYCQEQCVPILWNENHCGACQNKCDQDLICFDGQCQCNDADQYLCPSTGECVDTNFRGCICETNCDYSISNDDVCMNHWKTSGEECDDGDGLAHNGCTQQCEVPVEAGTNTTIETAYSLRFYPSFSPGYTESAAEAFAAPMSWYFGTTYYYKFTVNHPSSLKITTGTTESLWDASRFEWDPCHDFSNFSLVNSEQGLSMPAELPDSCAEITDYQIAPGNYIISSQAQLFGVRVVCLDCDDPSCGDLLCNGIETLNNCPQDCDPNWIIADDNANDNNNNDNNNNDNNNNDNNNNDCGSELEITDWDFTQNLVSGNNSTSRNQGFGTASCGGGGLVDVYYFNANRSGSHIFTSTVVGNTDTLMYATNECPTLQTSTELACNDDLERGNLSSRIRFDLNMGESAYIIVDSYNGSSTGNYNLSYNFCPSGTFCEF